MGDTHRDPIDHYRTALPHIGATFKDAYLLPGIALLTISVIATAIGLASAGYMHRDWSAVIVAIAVVSGVLGVIGIVTERRRVWRIDDRWHESRRDGQAPSTAGDRRSLSNSSLSHTVT